MEKRRNGLLEIYRFILCFWPMYHHNFFFFTKGDKFSLAELAVDFFFVISGFFLLRSMEKKKDEHILRSAFKLMVDRVRPFAFTLRFIAAFNFICVALFIREDHFKLLFELFKYWWYVLYLTIAIGIFYLLYRLIKNKKIFGVLLFVVALSMGAFHYCLDEMGLYIYEFTFVARTFGCIAFGMLMSYIPNIKVKRFNPSLLVVIALVPTIFYLAYNEKTYVTRLLMLGLFAALVYFTYNVSIGGRFFDLLGKLSTRMYLYMSFVTMFHALGLTNHRILFVIDVTMAIMDLSLTTYREKYLALKKQIKEKATL